ncbi:restriction endonuclease subunit S [Desulforhopalus sp. IMCC35007]|uniref:restriction endonuclease subunit S n=1 Tax=Desulforhopalus sp. IMCC35007 TaxID=2569543 RepID=UPI0010ADFBF7|nr:restriction endonuclease subunit S [Desulforhopalus sp. IMCC35007]TKB05536.1 hypothetical protein FCL48_24510 [Desulforhopalus sp. IMCC35007]
MLMKREVINIPKLRFSEFDEEWQVQKLGAISKIQRGRFSPRPRNDPAFYGGEIPFVQTSDVVNSNGKIKFYTQTLNEKGLSVSKLFPKGTILITIAANIGYTGVLQVAMACPDSLIGITCKKGYCNNEYLNIALMRQQRRMDYLAPEAAQKNINIEFLEPYPVAFPTLPEQQKIASFLTAVDKKIEQLTRKKELLGQYKKGVMQKIFSQEIRFKDDNGQDYPDWEEKRLGCLLEEFKGKSKTNDEYEVLTSSNKGLMKQSEYYGENRLTERENSGFNIIPEGFLTYRTRSDNRKFFFNENTLGVTGIISTYYPVFKMKNGASRFFIELSTLYKGNCFPPPFKNNLWG